MSRGLRAPLFKEKWREKIMDISNFNVPVEFEAPSGRRSVGNGVEEFTEQSKWVPFRFAYHSEPWKADKVKAYGYQGYDESEVIVFYKSKLEVPTVRLIRESRPVRGEDGEYKRKEDGSLVREFTGNWTLPDKYNVEPFITAYERWKAGQEQPGTSLAKWGGASSSVIATLAAMGVFTVESLADKSEGWIRDQFPPSQAAPFMEALEKAVYFRNAQQGLVDGKEQGDMIMSLQNANEKLLAEIEELKAKTKGRGRPKKQSEQ